VKTNVLPLLIACALAVSALAPQAVAQVAVRGETVYTMAGAPIPDGMIVIKDGKIAAIGRAGDVVVPEDFRVLSAKVVTPGLVDAHSVVGVAGIYNYDHDQDQLERSDPIQPELRAIDAYNAHEALVAWIRSFGVTTIHTGHAPGQLVSGQTCVVKTVGNTVEDAVLVPARTVAVTLGVSAQKDANESPGTRGKMMALLRSELLQAREYLDKQARAAGSDEMEPPARELRRETFGRVLEGELPLMITAHRAQDIANALRLADEFKIAVWLDGAAESYLLIDEILAAKVPVIVHPTMLRAYGETENLSFETASKLVAAGVPVALQSGYESYVPKTRVVLLEAAVAAAHGLAFDRALEAITIDSARLLEVDDRVGSLEVGKDGDVALYDGDPFEYTTHCTGVVISGEVVSDQPR